MTAAACAEFPNDNPALYRSAVRSAAARQGATSPCDLAKAGVRRAAGDSAGARDGVKPASDSYDVLVGVLEEVARALPASEGAAVMTMRRLLGGARIDAATLPATTLEALLDGKVLERTPGGLERAEGFSRKLSAWQDVLRAQSEDFSACGAQTLDEWAADLVARSAGRPSLASGLQRELRRRGVAAFGLVTSAA